MRTVMRAWQEEADGRKARSLRIAVPKGTMVEEGRHTGRLGSGDCLSTEHVPWRPAPERLRAVLQDTERADLPKELQAERRRHEPRGEICGARLPADRSAVPAGSLARLLLTYARLVEGGRLRKRRRESARRRTEQKDGRALSVGPPAYEDKKARELRSGSGDWQSERVASCGGRCCREGTGEMHAGWPVRLGCMVVAG